MSEKHKPFVDRLWVPLLTHYRREDGAVVIDTERMEHHVTAIGPDVRQYLLAGSTGDGWELDDAQFDALLRWATRSPALAGCRILFGSLRETTPAVVARAEAVERHLAATKPFFDYAGLAVCPMVQPDAGQDAIQAHYEAVLAATIGPLAVYQLPQVTQCSLTAPTLRALCRDPRVTMFKDTSGMDAVAMAEKFERLFMVRGAEGGYVEALKPAGLYDGWLLSTGNAFAPMLRAMLDLQAADQSARAALISATMAALIDHLFNAAQPLPFGNAFSNANRAVDHLRAYGAAWRDVPPPVTRSGNVLPETLLDEAEFALRVGAGLAESGYLAGTSIAKNRSKAVG